MAYSADPALYLYTSLTAGSSHIITATSRLETILKANKIPFRAIDVATDEKARMLWGRRSRGRKLPGLVRYGSIVGDLDQIEEWNEYGELKEQINATQDSGTRAAPTVTSAPLTTVNPTETLHPEPPTTSSRSPSNASSRASSQGRHISITEPTAKEKQRDLSPKPTSDSTAKSPPAETPQNLMMRQLGAEAAAKAKDRKASSAKAAPTSSPESTAVAQTAPPTSAKQPGELSPSEATEMAAAKTPALLAAEGKSKTSTDKIEEQEASLTSPTAQDGSSPGDSESKSTEEQLLMMRRSSTQTKLPTRLSESTPVERSGDVLPEQETAKQTPGPSEKEDTPETHTKTEAEPAAVSRPAEESTDHRARAVSTASAGSGSTATSASTSNPPPPERRRSHRGSSLEEADKEAIRRAEEAIRIQEEDEEDEIDSALEPIAEKADKRERGDHSEEMVEIEKEKVLEEAKVGVGRDVGSDEVAEDDEDDDEEEEEEEEEENEGEEKEHVKDVDAEKEEAMDQTKVDLPTGKETDVEAEDDESVKEKPQTAKAAEVDDASKSVGD